MADPNKTFNEVMLFSNFLGEVKNGKAIENYTKTIRTVLVSQDQIEDEHGELPKPPPLPT